MGVEPSSKNKNALPLPAPTETESTTTTPTEVATDVSRPGDEISSYSLPEDGTPVTIKTRGHSSNHSQTSLVIEYFESKSPGPDSLSSRKPSVRVRLKPSGSRKNDHIMISKPKSTVSTQRKTSLSRRSAAPQKSTVSARDLLDDERSISSCASATEESNVSRNNPIVVEIDRSAGHARPRPRRPTSPLIPVATSHVSSNAPYASNTQSEFSVIPADSFLDGSKSPGRSSSPFRDLAAAAAAKTAAAAAGAAALERNRASSRTRVDDRERAAPSKASSRDKERDRRDRDWDRDRDRERNRDRDRDRDREVGSSSKSERRHRSSRSRASSHIAERDNARSPSRRRSSRHRHHHSESVLSGTESSVVSSALSPSHRSYDHSGHSAVSKASSINNPKLLETVEDAIRRLILPELNALKREHSRKDRRGSTTSTATSGSRDDYATGERRRSGNSERVASASQTPKDKDAGKRGESREQETRHDVENTPPGHTYAYDSGDEDTSALPTGRSIHDTPQRSTDKLRAAAMAGAALAATSAMMADHDGSPATARDQRRARRAEARARDVEISSPVANAVIDAAGAVHQDGTADLYLSGSHSAASHSFVSDAQRDIEQKRDVRGDTAANPRYLHPPMPLMSEINSELTRTSILSAESDRPRSASEELQATPILEVSRGVLSSDTPNTPTAAAAPVLTLRSLGVQHANVSHGDLRALPRKGAQIVALPGDEDSCPGGQFEQDQYLQTGAEEEYDDYDDLEQFGSQTYDEYGHQIVPAPLKYTPYQPEHRGLSPIPSVSGYTEGGGSEVQGVRDSAMLGTGSSSPGKQGQADRAIIGSPSSVPSNVMSREFDHEFGSALSSDIEYRGTATNTQLTDGDDIDYRARDALGANPKLVHTPIGVESAVASLVDGSMLDGSALTTESSVGYGAAHGARGSMATLEEERSHGHSTPSKRSLLSHQYSAADEEEDTHERDYHHQDHNQHQDMNAHIDRAISAASPATTRTNPSEYAGQYEVDEYGRKYRRQPSPTASEAAITAGAVGLIIQAAKDRNQQSRPVSAADSYEDTASQADEWIPAGVERNKSFKERTMEGRHPANTPTHSADRLDDYEHAKVGASGLPDLNDPMPEIGYGYDDDLETNPSLMNGHSGDHQDDDWHAGDRTPTQGHHGHSGAAALSGASAALATSQHSRQASQDQDEEWRRSSDERKRDTLITNPYEGTSPIVNENLIKSNLPTAAAAAAATGVAGSSAAAAAAAAAANYGNAAEYTTRSPLGARYDEGYISEVPGKSPDLTGAAKGKGISFTDVAGPGGYGVPEDPFYAVDQNRHFSGMSHGMTTPIYDAATGAGIDRIENKDIMALMQHLMVRDAQRSARDTEILVTLVRAAAEMRTSFENVRSMLATHEKTINHEFSKKMADSEDAIITEILDGTDKMIRTHIGGPRPFPGSAARSLQAIGSQADMDDLPANAKRQNIFRRALKSLNAKGNNDLTRIEDMLNQLLTQVDELKAQSGSANGPGVISGSASGHGPSPYDGMAPMQYEQDRGYEPEGHAGTSTASHASQSGFLSVNSRGGPASSVKVGGYDRKFSDNRISTVHEANEEDYDYGHAGGAVRGSNASVSKSQDAAASSMRLAEKPSVPQMSSALRATTPQQQAQLPSPAEQQQTQQTPQSGENTPRTEKSRKHKSNGSAGWFPKISRWSETTTSSVGRVFRSSRDSKKDDMGSLSGRSGSDLHDYDQQYTHTGAETSDELHTGFSEPNLHQNTYSQEHHLDMQGYHTGPENGSIARRMHLTPEDPKYHAHRDSMNLQHPQPRSGHAFQTNLEKKAADFDSPMSPRSADWAGSATSLNRFPGQNTNRYSDNSAANEATGTSLGAAADDAAQRYWDETAPATGLSQAAPPRPPKEPLDDDQHYYDHQQTPPRPPRVSNTATTPGSYQNVESGYGASTLVPTSYTGSPRLENRNLNGALSIPTRRPSGPRAMTPKSERSVRSYNDEEPGSDSRRRKRDTFGAIASPDPEQY